MTSEDERAYSRSARNMALVLAAIVAVIFAAIFIPPLVNPVHEQFVPGASTNSAYGFSLNLLLNSTDLRSSGWVSLRTWLNNTSPQVSNVTAADQWPLDPSSLRTGNCSLGWPLGVGVMRGYYTTDNYTLGTPVALPRLIISCPLVAYNPPRYFLLQPHGSTAVVRLNQTLAEWNLRVDLPFGGSYTQPGAYTAVAADEWGDVALAHFRVGP
jgi:hypothetical protein